MPLTEQRNLILKKGVKNDNKREDKRLSGEKQ